MSPRKHVAPLEWPPDSKLSAAERECVEIQRRELAAFGVREPGLTEMAFMFATVLCGMRPNKEK